VKNHGGWVEVYSEVDQGTTFKVYLPLAEGAEPVRAEVPGVLLHGTGRVLLVDDEPIIRDVGSRMLRHLGYQVVTASDGQGAIDYFREFHDEIDLVIMDLVMPAMNGRDCFRALKRIDPEVKAVLSSGFGLNGEVQETIDEGMLGFVQKPYHLAELSLAVARALRPDGQQA